MKRWARKPRTEKPDVISSEEAYNIHMALMHNFGYWTRRIGDVTAVEVYDEKDGVLATVTLSADGCDWVIENRRDGPVVLPRSTRPAALADAIVREIERPE